MAPLKLRLEDSRSHGQIYMNLSVLPKFLKGLSKISNEQYDESTVVIMREGGILQTKGGQEYEIDLLESIPWP